MRKAQLAENILTYWAVLIAFAIIAIVFLTMFTPRTSVKTETISTLAVNNINLALLNYLRTPIEDGNVADLIVKSYYSNNFIDIEKKTKEILDPTYNDKFDVWNLGITKMPEDKLITIINKDKSVAKAISTSITIPLDKKSSLKITLVEGKLYTFAR